MPRVFSFQAEISKQHPDVAVLILQVSEDSDSLMRRPVLA